jgi:hypothetical protein
MTSSNGTSALSSDQCALPWWAEHPPISASLQTWEDYLVKLKAVPDSELLKKEVVQYAEYWIGIKRQRGDL